MSELAPAALRARLRELSLRDEHRLARRLQRGEDAAALVSEIEQAERRIAARRAAVPAVSYPPELPVAEHRDELLAAIVEHQVVVVAGETGSGKTTQLPKLCLELGRGVRGAIAHTQPRRIAARSVAERIAAELGVELGGPVGYAVRFGDRSGPDTLVRVMTDGLLLAELQRDRLLRRYDTIIVDEAHERSLNIDFLLGYVARLLPQRPELKLIVTSATIDPERFSRHFGDAPVVEVSGRTYPVEVRYRPPAEDIDQPEAIGDAVEELLRDTGGDVLVFLSGEREIRDAAEHLAGRLGPELEILPLYARLSSSEQQRVFQPHRRRRIVLATNVAETSLTVPGIRAVVDPGTARISRYSPRLKVQRLPIEPISQASADQRKGRCGRTAPGVCIRLYPEEDFLERPRFTDPEILRTSLAAVILQMAATGLGEVEEFPFLDPPDPRQVRDGIRLLEELGALDGRRLTRLGRRLAELPVDPRLGRMVLEADRLRCAAEVIPIVAALSIQDPRERPSEHQQAADEAHSRFADEASDFLAYLNLWRYLGEQQAALSASGFRKRCRAEFLHPLRVREWQDLAAQLRQAAREARVTMNSTPAEPEAIHLALLSGLLSHVGMRLGERREYQGARNSRFAIFPGSALARRPPQWVMVAELVETTRLWGRTAARIRPDWIEPLAGHLVRRSHDAPRWSRSRASVVATERVTLYGLPIVPGRTVAYGRIDPGRARELFIRCALIEGDWDAPHEFLEENRRRVREAEALEERIRRRGIVAGEQARFEFLAARVPEGIVSGADFDRWWRDERRRDPDRLTYPRELLVDEAAAAQLDPKAWPGAWRQGELVLALEYRFEPGADEDGVTVRVPLRELPRLRADGFDWLVPGLRAELVTALIRSLPKELRRDLVPVPELAAAVVSALRPRRGALVEAVARELERLRGVRVAAEQLDASRLPAHLRMRFRVVDEAGATLAEGRDLEALRRAAAPRLRAQLAAATAGLERHGLRAWTIGTLPRSVALPGTAEAVRGYPALVDEGNAVGVAVLESVEAQAAAMQAGTRRLLRLTVPDPARWVEGRLSGPVRLALHRAPYEGLGRLLEDATAAALDALIEEAGGPAWDEAGFVRLRDHAVARLAGTTLAAVEQVAAILDVAREVQTRLDGLVAAPLQPARRDVAAQLGRLVFPGFVAAAGVARLADVERYLRAAARRLERLPAAPAVDLDRMRAIHELEAAYRRRLEAWPAGRPTPPQLRELPWLLEELRVSQFAQGLGTREPVSSKRIRRALAEVG